MSRYGGRNESQGWDDSNGRSRSQSFGTGSSSFRGGYGNRSNNGGWDKGSSGSWGNNGGSYGSSNGGGYGNRSSSDGWGDKGNDNSFNKDYNKGGREPDTSDDFVRKTMEGAEELNLVSDGGDISEKDLFKQHTTGINFEKYDNIPVSCEGKNPPTPINTFEQAGLNSLILENVKRAEYTTPTPVQKHAIPAGLAGRDLMACAQTGSGKTAAFLLPILTKILSSPPPPVDRTRKSNPLFLVLAPTRELAIQIYKEALKFAYSTPLRCACVYGGAPYKIQVRDIERGAEIIVGTPGRLLDFLDGGKISLSRVKYLCFDEADRMLDMGFEKQIRQIVEERDLPPKTQIQTTMFSATFPKEIRQLASDFLNEYLFLKVGRVGSTTDSIVQKIKLVEDFDKRETVVKELKEFEGKTIIFVETKRNTEIIARFLYSQGYAATGIHGDRTQREREAALENFKKGRITILVATDVASRGLDIPQVSHVINYDLPSTIDSYIHRIGRTGRAGHTGVATSFYNEGNAVLARDLVKTLEQSKQDVPTFLKQHALDPTPRNAKMRRFAKRSQPYGGGSYGGSSYGGSSYGGSSYGGSGGSYGGRGGSSFGGRGGRGGSSFGGRGGFGDRSSGTDAGPVRRNDSRGSKINSGSDWW